MKYELNQKNQPVGPLIENWKVPCHPPRSLIMGTHCCLAPINLERHAQDLFKANALDTQGLCWTHLFYGPFDTFEDYCKWLENSCLGNDPQFYAIIDLKTNQAVGLVSYLRIDPKNGTIELGHINFSPLLKQKTAATEAMILMIANAFELGFRRFEWKCDALNTPSRIAAERLGFSFEGTFRQAVIIKGRNRDTAWYSIIDKEWPALKEVYSKWLAPSNFDLNGNQKVKLSTLTSALSNFHQKP